MTAFDTGPMWATTEEIGQGWRQLTGGAASPPLDEGVDIPWEQFDEWWIFPDVEAAAAFPKLESFVNNCGWAMRSLAELTAWFDPAWERDAFDWLPTRQARVWGLVEAHRPLAYASSGDRLIVVSSLPELLADVQERIRRMNYRA